MSAQEPRAVSVSVLKGGVGKSTIAIHLARALAARGNDALVIDLDPNGHASVGLGYHDEYQSEEDLGNVIIEDDDPTSIIHETEYEFDIIPSSATLESFERELVVGDVFKPSARLREDIVNPLLGDQYDYIITDSPAYRGKLADNALVASQNMIIPLTPGNESLAGFERTMERHITQLRKHMDLNILSIVPNMLSGRIDQQTGDRQLLEQLNSRENLRAKVPNFAHFTDQEFDQIDAGEYRPSPGIRERKAFTKANGEQMPVHDYDPDNDQLQHFDELAQIVEKGEVVR